MSDRKHKAAPCRLIISWPRAGPGLMGELALRQGAGPKMGGRWRARRTAAGPRRRGSYNRNGRSGALLGRWDRRLGRVTVEAAIRPGRQERTDAILSQAPAQRTV